MGVALLHSGIADRRQWARELAVWPGRLGLVAPDLPGFGEFAVEPREYSLAAEVCAVLDEHGLERAALVGSSFGGRAALETALERPERVTALVLVGAGFGAGDRSAELRAADAEEEELLARGELRAAAELMARTWIPGAPEDVRRYVVDAQVEAYRLQEGVDASLRPVDIAGRLGELRLPTLVVVGELDVPDMQRAAGRLEAGIAGAERAVVQGAYHLPNLERPDAFDAIVLPFLERSA